MLMRVSGWVLNAPRRVLAAAAIILIASGVYGAGVASHLTSGGFTNPDADSQVAADFITAHFDAGTANLIFVIDSGDHGTTSDQARDTGRAVVGILADHPDLVGAVQSAWTSPKAARADLISTNGRYGLVVGHVPGGEDQIGARAATLVDAVEASVNPTDGVQIIAGGSAVSYHQIESQTKHDLTRAEAISIPITTIVLILVFGSLWASLVPLAVGIVSILASLATLRLLTNVADVSIYAMNMTTAMGLALAIDYSLFMVSRFREELATGSEVREAVVRTVATAGRTVGFSALTVALALAALLVFPMPFLRSFGYAGLAVVSLAALASWAIVPAVLMLMGHRINALDIRAWGRRLLGRPDPVDLPIEKTFWHRVATRVMGRPLIYGGLVVALLAVVGSPFLRVTFGFPDDRVLHADASSHQVGSILREEFAHDAAGDMLGASPDAGSDTAAAASYSAAVSRLDHVTSVTGPAGTFADGAKVADPQPGYSNGDAGRFTIATDVDPFSSTGVDLVGQVRDQSTDLTVWWGGLAALNLDALDGIAATLPLALALIALATYVVLFMFTGSVVIPLKALALNVLSLSATLGAMVWIFQEGNLSGLLGFTPTGFLVANMVVLMFCLAFGMSMDYEVFLLSRIREAWLDSDRSVASNQHAVALGLARTGKIVTAAALLMSIVFASMVTSKVVFMQLFGLGLALAVLTDATLVRGVLVPAFMKLMGRANWWAPGPLRRFHDRFGFKE